MLKIFNRVKKVEEKVEEMDSRFNNTLSLKFALEILKRLGYKRQNGESDPKFYTDEDINSIPDLIEISKTTRHFVNRINALEKYLDISYTKIKHTGYESYIKKGEKTEDEDDIDIIQNQIDDQEQELLDIKREVSGHDDALEDIDDRVLKMSRDISKLKLLIKTKNHDKTKNNKKGR